MRSRIGLTLLLDSAAATVAAPSLDPRARTTRAVSPRPAVVSPRERPPAGRFTTMPIDMVEIIATNRRDVPGPAWSMPRRDIRVTAPNARHRTYETAMPIVNYGGSTLRQPPPRRSIPNSPRPPASR